jgi:hypothetical protein
VNTHQTRRVPRLAPEDSSLQVSGSPTCTSIPAVAHDTHNAQEAALRYAAAGLPVFLLSRSKIPVALCRPCRTAEERGEVHDKEACGCLLCHGFYAAITDPDRIRGMFRRVPGSMLAMRAGAVGG